MAVGSNEHLEVDRRTSDRNRRRISWAIALSAFALIASGATVLYRYIQIECQVHIATAELSGKNVLLRIETRCRDGSAFHTIQKLRETGSESEATWVKNIESSSDDHWRFPRVAAADIVIPLADVSTLDWKVHEGDQFALKSGDELPLLSAQISGRYSVDIDYSLRVQKRE